LPTISKIIEKVVKKRLLDFIVHHKLLYKHQYGFRPKSGVENAIFSLISDVQSSLDCGYISAGVFLDISKAFDTVDHGILLGKLERYGVRGVALKWFKSYLSDRVQFVSVNNTDSTHLPVTYGVPQGSVLGPILVSLYINDLGNLPLHGKIILFADDTNVFYQGDSPNTICNEIQDDLIIIQQWFRNSHLKISSEKCSLMWFSKPSVVIHAPVLPLLDDKPITVVSSAKFLGITLDSHLNWIAHINSILTKISPFVRVFLRCNHYLSNQDKRSLYFALVHSHLSFLCNIWGHGPDSSLNRLFIMQKRILKILFEFPYRQRSADLFCSLSILTVQAQIDFTSAIFMYKMVNNLTHCNVILKKVSEIHNYNTRSRELLSQKRPNSTTYGLNNVLYRAISHYNSLPSSIRSLSFFSFKKMLKKDCLSKMF